MIKSVLIAFEPFPTNKLSKRYNRLVVANTQGISVYKQNEISAAATKIMISVYKTVKMCPRSPQSPQK